MIDEWEADWHKSDPPVLRDDPGYWTIEGKIVGERYGVIADTLNRDHCISPEEDRQNAKLLAGSRRLLAASKAAAAALKFLNGEYGGFDGVLAELEASVAKAEGA